MSQKVLGLCYMSQTWHQTLKLAYHNCEWSFLQTIKPPHDHRFEAERKNFTHQCPILEVDGYALVVVSDMLDKVELTVIVHKERFDKSLGRSMLSISSKNGEQNICCKALLIASFPKF